ncbi:MAG: glycoside hydrolase family 5 protein [Bacilli bacterium]|nr:glycoside hydrolase family 5 protein [Bacilli bacterium]
MKTLDKVRGVNLGGWLVLEKWMTPSIFEGLSAKDETSWCVEMGPSAEKVLKYHWNTFITEKDFKWIADVGLNVVRIPVGFWIFGLNDYPYHEYYKGNPCPFVKGGIKILDKAFDWAEKYGIKILIDLHCAPACQNSFDNGGIMGVCEWHTRQDCIDYALLTLERLAERYTGREGLYGIETLNEPRWDIPTEILKDFNTEAYYRIRLHCSDDVAVVYHDGFRSYTEWNGFLAEPEFKNVVLDVHRYRCFTQEDINSDIYKHIVGVAIDLKQEADDIINAGHKVFLGEWSLGLDLKVVSLWADGPFNHPLVNMDSFQKGVAERVYGAAQLTVFEKYLGWFFWSYKTETTPAWCFKKAVENGWLPNNFRSTEGSNGFVDKGQVISLDK